MGRRVTVASVCTMSGVWPDWARRFERAIEKHAACRAAINCSGFEPGPSSKRDLNVYPPLMVSPAVNVPVPVGTSPCHSALPFAGMSPSLFILLWCDSHNLGTTAPPFLVELCAPTDA